jgi:hypothetical protein
MTGLGMVNVPSIVAAPKAPKGAHHRLGLRA